MDTFNIMMKYWLGVFYRIRIIPLQKETQEQRLGRVRRELKDLEKEVGKNNDMYRKIEKMDVTLKQRRKALDEEHTKTDNEFAQLERKNPHLTFDEFRKFCTLKYTRSVNRSERSAVNHRLRSIAGKKRKLKENDW